MTEIVKTMTRYRCLECKFPHPEFEFTGFKEHMLTYHKVDTATTKAQSVPILHMDGRTYSLSTWNITFENGMQAQKTTTSPRHKDSQMSF